MRDMAGVCFADIWLHSDNYQNPPRTEKSPSCKSLCHSKTMIHHNPTSTKTYSHCSNQNSIHHNHILLHLQRSPKHNLRLRIWRSRPVVPNNRRVQILQTTQHTTIRTRIKFTTIDPVLLSFHRRIHHCWASTAASINISNYINTERIRTQTSINKKTAQNS